MPLLLVGGVWALRSAYVVDRRALGSSSQVFPGGAFSAPPPDVPHHHGGHHGGDGGGGLF